MALRKCKECGEEISSDAKICPKCGKDQRNFFQKHIVLTIFLVFIGLGVIGSIGTNTSTPATIKRNSSSSSISNNTEIKENIVSIGDTITGKDWEVTIDSIEFSQRVDPPKKNMYYTYYQVSDSDNTYLYCILNCKNISTLNLGADKVATVTAKYDNKYTYTSFSAVPDDTLGFTYTSITSIKPLTSEKVYFMAEMPKSIADESGTPVEVIIKIENNIYKCKVR